jgi:hypothetical protein
MAKKAGDLAGGAAGSGALLSRLESCDDNSVCLTVR